LALNQGSDAGEDIALQFRLQGCVVGINDTSREVRQFAHGIRSRSCENQTLGKQTL
jgi:hypothetical protein